MWSFIRRFHCEEAGTVLCLHEVVFKLFDVLLLVEVEDAEVLLVHLSNVRSQLTQVREQLHDLRKHNACANTRTHTW